MVMGFTGTWKTTDCTGEYWVSHNGLLFGIWGKHFVCGYEGQMNNNGNRGFHCPYCGVKVLNEEHGL